MPWPQVREGQEVGRKAQGFRQAGEAGMDGGNGVGEEGDVSKT